MGNVNAEESIVVGPAERRQVDDDVELSARVRFRPGSPRWPERLWFRVPAAFEEHLVSSLDPFAVAMVFAAMAERAPLVLEGTISRRLGIGLREFQSHFAAVRPDLFRVTPLRSEGWHEVPREGSGIASLFSGGVDSFHTVRTCTGDGALPGGLSHAVFVGGSDILPWEDPSRWQQLVTRYSAVVTELGVGLLPVVTNARLFVPDIRVTYGALLLSAALAVSRRTSLLYASASSHFTLLAPEWGSSPRTDPLLGTEALQIVHVGYHLTRHDKVGELVDWAPFLDNLRVCFGAGRELLNCGRCEKCLRTLVHLDIWGGLPKQQSFPPVDRRRLYRRVSWTRPGLRTRAWDVRREALAAGNVDAARRLLTVSWLDMTRLLRSGLLRIC